MRGNKVENGSFEESVDGTAPDGWSGGSGSTYDTTGQTTWVDDVWLW